jgi:hypothetical protein
MADVPQFLGIAGLEDLIEHPPLFLLDYQLGYGQGFEITVQGLLGVGLLFGTDVAFQPQLERGQVVDHRQGAAAENRLEVVLFHLRF